MHFCKLSGFCSDVTVRTAVLPRLVGVSVGEVTYPTIGPSGRKVPYRAKTGHIKYVSHVDDESVSLGTCRDNMGRTRRNCPVFGCGSTNLARLANHLDQVHGMDTKENAKNG